MPKIDVEKELTDRLTDVAIDMQVIILNKKGIPCSEFYETLERRMSYYDIYTKHVGDVGKAICELLDLKKTHGLEDDYLILAGQKLNKYVQKDITEFEMHSNTIKELVDAEFKQNPRIKLGFDDGENTIRRIAEKYCWEKFGDPSVDRNTNNQRYCDESRRIEELALKLYLPFYSVRTAGSIKGQSYSLKQLKTALNKVKVDIE